MDLSLQGKIAIVGGASDGIGYGIARLLAAEGATVAITGRREARLTSAADRLRSETGKDVIPVQADCRLADDIARVISTVVDRCGGIDIVVNNDGAPPLGRIDSFDDTAWLKAVEQNFLYVVRMARGAVPSMTARGGGSIVNITATSTIQPREGFGLSVATWNAVIGFSKTLSLEVAKDGITVNTILPGLIATGRLEKVFGTGEDPAAKRAELAAQVPVGRIGTVDDIASLVTLLVSPRGSYITGTAINVDGGALRSVR